MALKWINWINVVAGVWVAAMPFVGFAPEEQRGISAIDGAIVVLAAVVAWYAGYVMKSRTYVWVPLINVAAGVWIATLPLYYALPSGYWVGYGVTGAVIAIVSFVDWLVDPVRKLPPPPPEQ